MSPIHPLLRRSKNGWSAIHESIKSGYSISHHESANKFIPEFNDTWASLDGNRLEFRTGFRPRARYLYFLYCIQVLRFAWKERYQGKVLREQELEKPVWASPGKYVKKNMLRAFLEELGHEIGDWFDSEQEDVEPVKTDSENLLLLAAASQIALNPQDRDVENDSDEGEETDEPHPDVMMMMMMMMTTMTPSNKYPDTDIICSAINRDLTGFVVN